MLGHCACVQDFLWAPSVGPLPSLKGSEPWAPGLKVVYAGVRMALQAFRIKGPYQGP